MISSVAPALLSASTIAEITLGHVICDSPRCPKALFGNKFVVSFAYTVYVVGTPAGGSILVRQIRVAEI
jgi:hypothetical protein